MIDDPTIREVLARYGFLESSITSVEPLGRGTKGSTLRVGADGRSWALKALPAPGASGRLRVSHDLELNLASKGFPVAPLRRAVSGEALVEQSGRWYSLREWVEGQQFTIGDRDDLLVENPDLLHNLASAVATMHQVAGSMATEVVGLPAVTAASLLASPGYAVRRIRRPRLSRPFLSKWHELRLSPDKSEFDRWIIQTFPDVATQARRLSGWARSNRMDESETLLIHNDLNWENLVFDNERRLKALLDFDNVITAPRIVEVGAAAVVFAGAARSRVNAFVSSYAEVAGVTLDLEALDMAMMMKCVQSILNSINTHLDGTFWNPALLESWTRHLYDSLQMVQRRHEAH